MPEFPSAPGSVCCLCSCCILWKPLLPSWKQLQDTVLFGGGQGLVLSSLAQPGEGGTEECREILSYTISLFYICLCKLTQHYVLLFQFEILKLQRSWEVVGHEIF